MSDYNKTTVYLPAAEYRRLKALAAAEGRSTAELIREAVVEYARRRTQQKLPRSIGAFRLGGIAENYEDHMDGFGES